MTGKVYVTARLSVTLDALADGDGVAGDRDGVTAGAFGAMDDAAASGVCHIGESLLRGTRVVSDPAPPPPSTRAAAAATHAMLLRRLHRTTRSPRRSLTGSP